MNNSNSLSAYADPTYGVLIPNPVIFAWLGIPDNQLRSLREQNLLSQGTDYIRQSPHQMPEERKPIFWTLTGLYRLCGLLGTIQAQQFRAMLDQFVQAPGALVPAMPTMPQTYGHEVFGQSEQVPEPQPMGVPTAGYAPLQRHTPAPSPVVAQHQAAEMVAQAIAPQIRQAIAQNTHHQQSQADLMFRQQELELRKFETYAQVITGVQRQTSEQNANLVANLPVSDVFIQQPQVLPWWKRIWYDPAAFTLFLLGSGVLLGIITFALVSALTPAPSPRNASPAVVQQ